LAPLAPWPLLIIRQPKKPHTGCEAATSVASRVAPAHSARWRIGGGGGGGDGSGGSGVINHGK